MRIFGTGWEEQVLAEFRTYWAAAERKYFLFHKGSLQGRNTSIFVKRRIEVGALGYGDSAITPSCSPYFYNLPPHPFRSGRNRPGASRLFD